MTTSITRGLKQAQRAVGEVAQEGAGIVNADLLDLARERVGALFDERFRHGRNIADRTIQPEGCVDAVGQQVAGHSGASCSGVQTPQGRSTLWEVGIDGPVLEEVGSVVEDLAQAAFVDQLFGQCHGRHAAIVVPDGVQNAGRFDGFDHLVAFGCVHRKWLFAEDHLAGLGGGDGDLGVAVVGRADINGVDILALNQLAPIGLDRLIAPLVGKGLGAFGAAATDGLQNGPVSQFGEEVVHTLVAVGVRPAHEAVADQADVQRFLCAHWILVIPGF